MNNHSCEIEIRVRYAETDRMGYVYHGRYWVYFEMGRTELLRQGGCSYRQWEEAGVFLVVTAASVRYRSPAHYDDVLTLRTYLTRTGRASIEHAYELRRDSDGVVIATARTTLACVGADGRPTALPQGLSNRSKAD